MYPYVNIFYKYCVTLSLISKHYIFINFMTLKFGKMIFNICVAISTVLYHWMYNWY